MNRWRPLNPLASRILAWIAVLAPVFCFLGLLRGPGLWLAKLNRDRGIELARWHDNVYRDSWLDSAQQAQRMDRDFLAGVHDQVERRLLSDSLFGGSVVDSLRREAQAFGCEVLRLSPTRDSSGGLRRLRLRMESRAAFPAAMSWFRNLESRRPEAYVEEALLRPDPRGRLEIQITLLFHSRATP